MASADLNATDPDNTNDTWTAVALGTATVGGFGTYQVTTTGVWTYTLDDTNAAVQALQGADTLSDFFMALTADGTAQLVSITIRAQNDTPVLAEIDATAAYAENSGSVVLDGALLLSDVDAPSAGSDIASATVRIAEGFVAGDILGADTTGTAITIIYLNGVLTLSGADTLANYQEVLKRVTFASTSENPTDGGASPSRTIEYVVADLQGAATAPQQLTLGVMASNDAPVNTLPGSVSVRSHTNISISDPAVADADAGPASLSTTLSVAHGTLTVASAGGAVVGGSGSGLVTLTGTVAQINATLSAAGNVIYRADIGFVGTDTLTMVTHDGGSTGSPGVLSDTDLLSILVRKPENDFDGDLASDILWRRDGGENMLWLVDGDAVIADLDLPMVATTWHIEGVGDFNGDGHSDILWRHSDGRVDTWEMRDGAFAGGQTFGIVSNAWHVENIGDFNGDGHSDILWRHDSGEVNIWDMRDGVRLGPARTLGVISNDWHIEDTGDFNGDGHSDILWRRATGQVDTWELRDGALAGGKTFGVVSNVWHIEATGDFNGDGHTDILWRHDSGEVNTWELRDGVRVGGHGFGIVANTWHIEDTRDFNGDGHTDILWRHDSGEVNTWELHDGVRAGVTVSAW